MRAAALAGACRGVRCMQVQAARCHPTRCAPQRSSPVKQLQHAHDNDGALHVLAHVLEHCGG